MASELLSEVKTYFGRCRCCLAYGYLKNMWKKHTRQGEAEIYGEMLTQCFALTWDQQELGEQDQICEPCVLRLRDAVEFKQLVIRSQKELMREMENDADEANFQIKIEDDNVTIIKAEITDLTSNHNMSVNSEDEAESIVEQGEVYAEPSVVAREEPVFEEVEYLEEEAADMSSVTSKTRPLKYVLTRKHLFEIWACKTKCPGSNKVQYMIETLSKTMPHINTKNKHFRKRMKDLCRSFENCWRKCGRSKERFLARTQQWLRVTEKFELSKYVEVIGSKSKNDDQTSNPSSINDPIKVPDRVPNNFKNKIQKSSTDNKHIKKPLNAFLLFMKDMRPKLRAEDLGTISNSTVNQILGQRWNALPDEEKARYYEMQRLERERHKRLYPDYKPYFGPRNLKKKRKIESNPLKKCRARYGLESVSLWCVSCKRKKKCIGNMEALAAAKQQPPITTTTPTPTTTTTPTTTITTTPAPTLDVEVKEEIESDASSDIEARLNSASIIDFEKDTISEYFSFTEPDGA